MSSPDHAVPGLQDLTVLHCGHWGDDLGEQQPGPGSVLRFRVGDQVRDECWGELVLFGPDGEGPAEVPAVKENQTSLSHYCKWSTLLLLGIKNTNNYTCDATLYCGTKNQLDWSAQRPQVMPPLPCFAVMRCLSWSAASDLSQMCFWVLEPQYNLS